jgi:hypothetical protein
LISLCAICKNLSLDPLSIIFNAKQTKLFDNDGIGSANAERDGISWHEHLDRDHSGQCLVYASGDHAFAVEIDSQPIPDHQFVRSQNSSEPSLLSVSRPCAYSFRAPPYQSIVFSVH